MIYNTKRAMIQETPFATILEKYAHWVRNSQAERRTLLITGHKLFDHQASETTIRPSWQLLRAKELELKSVPKIAPISSKKMQAKPAVAKSEVPASSPDQLADDIMVLQDRNGVLLARRKALEKQRDLLNEDYGALMEKSVRQKVKLKLQVQKLKSELTQALSRSQSTFTRMDEDHMVAELAELNNQIVQRINGFKIALRNDSLAFERCVMERFQARMEKLLGVIYAHSDQSAPHQVLYKFTSTSEAIEHETRDIDTEIRAEHERNNQLQKEAKQLEEELKKQQNDVNQLKKHNAQWMTSIQALHEISEKEIVTAKEEYRKLFDLEDEGAMPSSARAMIVTNGHELKQLTRTSSGKLPRRKDGALLGVKPLAEFVKDVHLRLQELINQYRIAQGQT
jgi:predicted nuclease with TOPRIM domain